MALTSIDFPPIHERLTAEQMRDLDLFGDMLAGEAMPQGFVGDCSREELDLRHILDSILPAIAPESAADFPLWQKKPLNVFDLGAGAGLPSLPLAILFPQHRFFLIDSQEKRCKFCESAMDRLQIKNVRIFHTVVQNYDKPEKADVVMFRAFRKVLASLELSLHIMPGPTPNQPPKVLYWRSQPVPFSETGLKRVAELGFTIDSFVKFASAENILPRGLYTFSKKTPAIKPYPRSWKKISADKLVEVES